MVFIQSINWEFCIDHLRKNSFPNVHDGTFGILCNNRETINDIFDGLVDDFSLLGNNHFDSLFNLLNNDMKKEHFFLIHIKFQKHLQSNLKLTHVVINPIVPLCFFYSWRRNITTYIYKAHHVGFNVIEKFANFVYKMNHGSKSRRKHFFVIFC